MFARDESGISGGGRFSWPCGFFVAHMPSVGKIGVPLLSSAV